jgi:hypothetical protein
MGERENGEEENLQCNSVKNSMVKKVKWLI